MDQQDPSKTDSPAVYELTLEGGGISVRKAVSSDQAATIIGLVLGGRFTSAVAGGGEDHAADNDGPGRQARQPERSDVRLSLREFLDDVGAKSNPAKIAAIGQFVRDQDGRAAFTRDDARSRFRLAGEPAPGNFPRDFQVAVQSGWIAEDHQERGSYYVTRKGDDAIAAKFSGARSPAAKARRRRRSATESQGESD